MEIRKNLELVDVNFDGEKAIMTFLDEKKGQVLDVNFNKQSYDSDSKKFVDDKEKSKKVDEWCKEYFDTTFKKLPDCIGVKKDIYVYEKFNSLWEVSEIKRFEVADEGEIFTTTIKSIEDDGIGIKISYDWNDAEYRTNMGYSDYIKSSEKWYENPQKKARQFKKFEDKFGVPFEEKDTLIGKEIMVEIKTAFGDNAYGEIKKPKWD